MPQTCFVGVENCKPMKFARFIFLLLFLYSCEAEEGTKTLTDPIYPRLDSLITNSEFSGVVFAARDSALLYTKAIGYSDIENEELIKPDDRFVIGSISKQITAVLVLREYEKGKLKIEDTIDKYLSAIEQPWAKEITIHHLLTHTHGISAIDEALAFEPGSRFRYSQLGYDLLAQILEEVTAQSFSGISEDLFTEFGLKNTFHPEKLDQRGYVKGYAEQENGDLVYTENSLRNYPAAGSFISTAEDLIRWNYLLHSNQLVQAASLKLMKTRYATREHPIFDTVEYGYGLLFKEGEENIQIGALGYAPGFVSAAYYHPKSKMNLVVLQNTARHLSDFRQTFGTHLNLMEAIKKHK